MNRLVPAVIQDVATAMARMLGTVTWEACDKPVEPSKVPFFSRT